MTVRGIQQHIQEIYQVGVSPTLISNVTEAVIKDVTAWQNGPLDSIYPILYMSWLCNSSALPQQERIAVC